MKKEIFRGLTSIFAFFLVLSIFGTNIALANAGTINAFLSITTSKIVTPDNGTDTEYFKSGYGELSDENLEKLLLDSYGQCVAEQAEGSVLLKNENEALPLRETERSVTLFGRASADPVYKPTSGAAPASGEFLVTYYDAMKNEGFEINEELFKAYGSSETKRIKRSAGGVYDTADMADIGEESRAFYTDRLQATWEQKYNDAAVVMLSREGGEDADLLMKDDEGISQLALHQDEKDLLQMIKDSGKFKKTIVLLNSPWAMETGWLDEYDIDACLWIGNTGLRGFEGVAKLLTGEYNPSGKLVDTYASNSLSAPACTYATDNTQMYANAGEIQEYCSDDDKYVSYYAIYAEGIYVGYKYYETRYEDCILGRYQADSSVGSSTGGEWNYADEICYPFGFGLSYTTFEQTLDRVEQGSDLITVTVSVTNTGDTAGKSVVELYAQKPYGEYEIKNKVESSAVQMVGFGKTGLLNPGETQQITITVDPYLLASYDYTNAKGYIMSQGDYYLSIGDDAHDALNNILAAKDAAGMFDHEGKIIAGDREKTYTWEQKSIDTDTYRHSRITGAEVTNQFDKADINNLIPDTITYLSRSDWEATYPEEPVSVTATGEMIRAIHGYNYEKPEDSPSVSDFTQGADNGLNFADMKEAAYEDEETWNRFLDQMTIEDLCSVISTDMSGASAVESVVLPATTEGDGIDGVKASFLYGDKRSATAFPGKAVLASAWSTELYENRGKLMAEEALYCNYPTIWCGGGDIHRTPFSGRNFEYYSEDGYVTYFGAGVELKAMQDKGLNAGIKHFCGNDQEHHRESLSTFFNEQSFRENNLRAFEGAFCNAGILDTMQGFNRIGCTYMAQCPELMTGVLRDEWGYKGKVITDAVAGMSYKTHYLDSLSAGTDYYCWDKMAFGGGEAVIASSTIYKHITENDDGYMLQCLRRANKNIYYALSRSMAVNGLNSDSRVVTNTPWWQYSLYAAIAISGLLSAAFCVLYGRSAGVSITKRREKE